jgi:hypothetical protein
MKIAFKIAYPSRFFPVLLLAATVAAGCAGTATQDSTGQYVDDSAITAKVKAALSRQVV